MSITTTITITNVRFASAGPGDRATGLLGFVSATLNESIHLDGLTLRRTADGRLTLAYPARKDPTGKQHFFVRPLSDEARREVEAQVFQALGIHPDER